jgi:hypothetical protein
MFFPAVAAIITIIGAVGFVISSLVHASGAGNFIFNASAACMVAGPLIFLFYVIVGLFLEFLSINRIPDVRITAGGPSPDVPAALPSQAAFDDWVPEGLLREHKGPLNRSTGRAAKI